MEIYLSQICNVKPTTINARRQDFRSVYAFLCGIACEYAVNVLKKNTEDSLYNRIMSYCSSMPSPKSLWNDLTSEDREMNEFVRAFSFSETESDWAHLSNNTKWVVEENQSTFSIGEFSFSCKKTFLDLVCDHDNYVALELKISETEDYFSPIHNAELSFDIKKPAKSSFYKDLQQTEIPSLDQFKDYSSETHVNNEQFFSLSEDLSAADADQREAITSDIDKNLLILAGAGSGKTRSLVGRVTYLHLVKGIPLHRIRLLTFTRAAAIEMSVRGKDQLEKAYEAAGIHKKERPYVLAGTIDAFFKKLIEENYIDIGFVHKPTFLYGNTDQGLRYKLLLQVIKENSLESVFKGYFSSEKGMRALYAQLEAYINHLSVNVSGIENLLHLYIEKQKRMSYIADFACAAYMLKMSIADRNGSLYRQITNDYDCILIDEFQDINTLQNDVLSCFYSSRIHFTFVGDDDQTIYTWRGADNSIIRSFTADTSIRSVYLTTNYRNNPYIVKAGNDILASLAERAKGNRIIKAAKQFGSKVRLTFYDEKYANLAHEVKNLYAKRKPGEQICILYREDKKRKFDDGATSQLSERDKILNALSIENVPYSKRDDMPSEFSEGYKLFKAIIKIQNKQDVRDSCVIIKEIVGEKVSNVQIRRLVTGKSSIPSQSETDGKFSLYHIYCLSESVNRKYQYAKNFSEIIENYNRVYAQICEGQSSTDRTVKDETLSYMQEYAREFALGYPLLQSELKGFFSNFEEEAQKRRPSRREPDNVVVTTIHNAKGLEYDTVFIVGLNEGEYPNVTRIVTEYNKKIDELKRFKDSKDFYNALKARVNNPLIDGLLLACDEQKWEEFSSDIATDMHDFALEINAFRDDYLELTEDGVKSYIEAYNAYVKPWIDEIENSIFQISKEIDAIVEDADDTEEAYSEMDEETEEYQATFRRWEVLRDQIKNQEIKRNKREDLLKNFIEKIKPLVSFCDICNEANGYLLEIRQSQNTQQTISRLTKEKQEKEFEEKRIFYVAVSRAINRLYLCTAENLSPSPFVRLINPENCENYTKRTYGQEVEMKRMEAAVLTVRKEIEKQDEKAKPDNKKIDAGIQEIFNYTNSFKEELQKYITEYKSAHDLVENIPTESASYLNSAIGLMVLSDRLGYNFDTEILHNLQRFAETYIRWQIGPNAVPFKTDEDTAYKIAEDIRKSAKRLCKTQKPGEGYIVELLSDRNRKYNDELEKCKNLAIECYAVGSNRYPVPLNTKRSWQNIISIDSAETFLCEVIDLANIRNDAVHKGNNSWRTDSLPYAWKIVDDIVRSFKNTHTNYDEDEEDLDEEPYEPDLADIAPDISDLSRESFDDEDYDYLNYEEEDTSPDWGYRDDSDYEE